MAVIGRLHSKSEVSKEERIFWSKVIVYIPEIIARGTPEQKAISLAAEYFGVSVAEVEKRYANKDYYIKRRERYQFFM